MAVMLSLTYLSSCATARKTNESEAIKIEADTTNHFVPTHPPVVVPHSWREGVQR